MDSSTYKNVQDSTGQMFGNISLFLFFCKSLMLISLHLFDTEKKQ